MSSTSGHAYLRQGKRGDVWYVKYRLPDGRQKKERLGRAWTERSRPPSGFFTEHVPLAVEVEAAVLPPRPLLLAA
jgi:hypothetical protein